MTKNNSPLDYGFPENPVFQELIQRYSIPVTPTEDVFPFQPENLDVFWFSPECKHHHFSKARGGRKAP